MNTQGVLFVAVGRKYIQSAIRAAYTVRKYCPDLPIHLFGNWQENRFNFDEQPYPFTSVENIENPHRRSKVDKLHLTPFQHTLYLDNDTALNADVSNMFELLDRFDIALGHAFWRNHVSRIKAWNVDLPQAFPQFNSGVILYQKTPKVLQLLEDWQQAYNESGLHNDQPTLRELLWQSDLRIATLPPEYNVRFMKYHYLWSRTEARTKIFHLRKYQDGPLWFIKVWSKRGLKAILEFIGIYPRLWNKLKK